MTVDKSKKAGLADLHVHTSCSDGVLSPGQVVSKALLVGLKAVAITDHDSVEGISESIKAAQGADLEIIPGVEISAAREEEEIHILGYFIDWQSSELVESLKKMKNNRLERMRKILANLHRQGVEIDEEKLFVNVLSGSLGRPHLARLLVEERVVTNTREAFDKYLGDGKPCHVKHKRLDYNKCIDMILGAGGVPVLAHPGTMGKDEYIPEYVQAGLRGIEVYHTKHGPSANKKYSRVAREYGLLETGGSDCHGTPLSSGEILIGRVTVPYCAVEGLRKESERLRAETGKGKRNV